MRSRQPTITWADQPERLEGQRVSVSYFRSYCGFQMSEKV